MPKKKTTVPEDIKSLLPEQEEDEEKVPQGPPPTQDPEELAEYILKLRTARDERTMPRKEFDGMTFEQDYERNRECTYSYLRPKKNDDDVRVNSGTTEKKIELMLNELVSMNFQPEVRAYDQSELEIVDLGADMTDLVRNSNEQENDEDMWEEVYLDLLTQRVAFVEECVTDSLPGGYMATGEAKTKCRGVKRRLSPLQVYFGDMYIPVRRLQEQPYLVVYDRMLYSEAKLLYGDISEWQYVKPGANIHDEFLPWFKYRFSILKKDEVEVIRIMSSAQHDDDDQIIINGVIMYPGGRKMTLRSGYPIKAATVKTIPDFAYGKPPIGSAKFLQALQDETIRNLVRKMRQAIEPPIGVKAGKMPTRDMWSAAAVTQGISADNYSKLIDHDGVTPSEFQMLQLITQKTEEFIGATNIQTPPGEGIMTATQIIELQKQAIKMLGTIVLAIIRLKRDATFARLETFTREYTKPLTQSASGGKVQKKYRTFEINDARTHDGQTVSKYIAFVDKFLSQEQLSDVMQTEESLSKAKGKDVRISFINVEAMKSIPLLFKVTVTPESRDSSSLDKVLFQDRLTQAATIAQISGKPLNSDKVIHDFEQVWKTKGWFADNTAPAAPGSPTPAQNSPQAMMTQLAKMAPPGGAQPPEGGQPAAPAPAPSIQGKQMKPGLKELVNAPK